MHTGSRSATHHNHCPTFQRKRSYWREGGSLTSEGEKSAQMQRTLFWRASRRAREGVGGQEFDGSSDDGITRTSSWTRVVSRTHAILCHHVPLRRHSQPAPPQPGAPHTGWHVSNSASVLTHDDNDATGNRVASATHSLHTVPHMRYCLL